jgi:hypothetical protein
VTEKEERENLEKKQERGDIRDTKYEGGPAGAGEREREEE